MTKSANDSSKQYTKKTHSAQYEGPHYFEGSDQCDLDLQSLTFLALFLQIIACWGLNFQIYWLISAEKS